MSLFWIPEFLNRARAFFCAYIFLYEKRYVFYRQIKLRDWLSNNTFLYRLATREDIDAMAVFEPHHTRYQFRRWLKRGCWIFAAFDGNRPISFECMSRTAGRHPPLSWISLTNEQLWVVNTFTLPEYRRRHVSSNLKDYRDRAVMEWGYREIASSVPETNIPSLSLAYRRNPDVIQRFTFLRLFLFRRMWMEEDARTMLEVDLKTKDSLRQRDAQTSA
jgi:hypothetical protein